MTSKPPLDRDNTPRGDASRRFQRLRRGWQAFKQSAPLQVTLCAVLFALRKPLALHTPQFWAEDGEVFMKQDDALGAAAILEPYNGYLHFLPRLIAWIASHTVDVAWWPAIYNGLAFAITVALFARLASRRVELPGKLWLMLAFPLVVGSGEPLINVTNLQWITAFFLLLQVFTAPATNLAQRVGDLAILVLVGLNGPFAIVFLPLFAWRAWRDRQTDAWLALGVMLGCAVTQGWFVAHAPLNLQNAGEPFRALSFFSILGTRLVTWPLLGPGAVAAWPMWVHATLAVALIGPLLLGALRRDALRPVRGPLVVAFGIITLASIYRVRADTWGPDNLVNGDRYFYIPRVLLAWLLVLEFQAKARFVRYLSRAACILAVVTHLPHFIVPAPPDYKWAERCGPIRRGEPAHIPTLPVDWFIDYPGRPKKP